jgi:hypothetical protein
VYTNLTEEMQSALTWVRRDHPEASMSESLQILALAGYAAMRDASHRETKLAAYREIAEDAGRQAQIRAEYEDAVRLGLF